MIEFDRKIPELLDLARKADGVIMGVYESGNSGVSYKGDNTPVTAADIASNEVLLQGLAELFPDIPIVSEEADYDTNLEIVQNESAYFVIDPLDGTNEFVKRTGQFAVGIGVVVDHCAVFGIISSPTERIQYFGGPHNGSFVVTGRDVEPVQIFTDPSANVSLVSASNLDIDSAEYIRSQGRGHTIKRLGSMLKFSEIATGNASDYPRLSDRPIHIWDVVPGHAILLGAGGRVVDSTGANVSYNSELLTVGKFIAISK
jgi:3'(2'), 5'-bisphosphate nucleotidase